MSGFVRTANRSEAGLEGRLKSAKTPDSARSSQRFPGKLVTFEFHTVDGPMVAKSILHHFRNPNE